jgi:hypothetical protein
MVRPKKGEDEQLEPVPIHPGFGARVSAVLFSLLDIIAIRVFAAERQPAATWAAKRGGCVGAGKGTDLYNAGQAVKR